MENLAEYGEIIPERRIKTGILGWCQRPGFRSWSLLTRYIRGRDGTHEIHAYRLPLPMWVGRWQMARDAGVSVAELELCRLVDPNLEQWR